MLVLRDQKLEFIIEEYEGDSWEDYPDPQYNDPKYGGQNTVTG